MSVFFTVNIAAHGFRWKRVILTGLRPAEDRGSFNEWDTVGSDTNTTRDLKIFSEQVKPSGQDREQFPSFFDFGLLLFNSTRNVNVNIYLKLLKMYLLVVKIQTIIIHLFTY